MRRWAISAITSVGLIMILIGAWAAPDASSAGLSFLIGRQNRDGSFGLSVDLPATALSMAVLKATGLDLSHWRNLPPPEQCGAWDLAIRGWALAEPPVLDRLVYLQAADGSWQGRADLTALAVLALSKGKRSNPRAITYLRTWATDPPPTPDPFALALAGLALDDAGETETSGALAAGLSDLQWPDGSWSGDAGITSVAVSCLRECLPDSPAIAKGRAFIADRVGDGGCVRPRLAGAEFTTALAAFCLGGDTPVDAMVAYLIEKGEPGFIPRLGGAVRATAAVAQVLRLFPEQAKPLALAQAWLQKLEPREVDATTARLLAAGLEREELASGLEALYSLRNDDGGFGFFPGEASNPLDTASALAVLDAIAPEDQRRAGIEAFLFSRQNPDGGWGFAAGSDPLLTAAICRILRPDGEQNQAALARALDYLQTLQKPDGSFGTVLATAAAGITLRLHARKTGAAEAFLLSRQEEDGSWEHDIYTTAMVLEFLNLFHRLPNLSIDAAAPLELVHAEQARLDFTIMNQGPLPVYNIAVRFWEGRKGGGGASIGSDRLILRLRPGESELVSLSYQPQRIGELVLGVEADPEDRVSEYNENDNLVYANAVVLPPTPAGFTCLPYDGRVELRWGQPPNITGLTGFNLARDGTPLGGTLSLATLAYTDTGLANGEVYEYTLTLRAGGLRSRPAKLRAAAVKPPEGIDLCLAGIRILPGTSLHVGQEARVAAVVVNRGLAPSPAAIVRLYQGDESAGAQLGPDQQVSGLSYAETAEVVFPWTPAAASALTGLTVVIDPGREIADTDRANNTGRLEASVSEAANLAVKPADLAVVTEYYNHPATPYWSWMMEGRVTVANEGKVPAGPFNIRLHGIDQRGYEVDLPGVRCPGLAPGERYSAPIAWQKALLSLFVEADCDNEVPETCETDNRAGRALPGVAGGIRADLDTSQILLAPGVAKTVMLRLANHLPKAVELDISPDCPMGFTALPQASKINLAALGVADVLVALRADSEGDYDFRLRVTGPDMKEIAVEGCALSRIAAVRILNAEARPDCVEQGETVEFYGVLFNAANWVQAGRVNLSVLDSEGREVWRQTDQPPITVGTRANEFPVKLGAIGTSGLGPGTYRVMVAMQDADGNPIPGAAAEVPFVVGSHLSVARTVSAGILPPGDSMVDVGVRTAIRGKALPDYPDGINAAWCLRGARVWGGYANPLNSIDGSMSSYALIGNAGSGQPIQISLCRDATINLFQLYICTNYANAKFGYKIESSMDGTNWHTEVDRSGNRYNGWRAEPIAPRRMRYIRVSGYPNMTKMGELRALTGTEPITVLPPFVTDSAVKYTIGNTGGQLAVGDLDRDGVPEIVIADWYHCFGIHDGQTGAVQLQITTSPSSAPFIGDIDADEQIELLIYNKIYNTNGMTERILTNDFIYTGSIADLEGDSCPEILVDNYTFTYAKHWDDSYQYYIYITNGGFGWPLSFDMNNDGFQEIFTNHVGSMTLLRSDGIMLWQIPNPPDPSHGRNYYPLQSCILDINRDCIPEIVTAYSVYVPEKGYREAVVIALDIRGNTIWRHAEANGNFAAEKEGLLAADLNRDGVPDIVMICGYQILAISGIDGSLLWRTSFGGSRPNYYGAAFDYDLDDEIEIVVNSSILSGLDGSIEAYLPSFSRPMFADVDMDGHTELILSQEYVNPAYTYILGDPTWAPARSVWSGVNYHITDITDDLRIPLHEEPSWILHNTYRVQGPAPGDIASYAITVEQDLPADAALVPGSVTPDPLSTQPDRLTWYYRLARTGPVAQDTGCAVSLTGMQPGQVVEVAGATRVRSVWLGGAREIVLPPVTVGVAHACWLAEDRVSVAEYGNATIGVYLKNHRAEAETYQLNLKGLPAQWVWHIPPVTLAPGEERLVPVKVTVPYGTGEGLSRFTVTVAGDRGTRDSVSGEFAVVMLGKAWLNLDKQQFAPEENLHGSVRLENMGQAALSLDYVLKVTNRSGALVRPLAAGTLTAPAYGSWTQPVSFDPGTRDAGQYILVFETYRDGLLFRSAALDFTILEERNLVVSFAADQAEYGPNAEVRLVGTFTNTGRNADYNDLVCTIEVLAPDGRVLRETRYTGPYLPAASSRVETYGWRTENHPPGAYKARITVGSGGQEAAAAECGFLIRPGTTVEELLTGWIEAAPRVVKGPMDGTITWTVRNEGNVGVSAAAELVLAGEQEEVLATEPVSLAPGEAISFTHHWQPPYAPGEYKISIRIRRGEESQTVAMGGYTAIPYDATPPVTSVTAPETWQKEPVTLRFTATDGESGVAATYYRVGASETRSGETCLLDTEGVHDVCYWSVDVAGNVEAEKSVTVRLDWTAPVIELSTPIDEFYAVGQTVRLDWRAADALSGVVAKQALLDGKELAADSFTAAPGEHTLVFRAVDAAGNETSLTRTFRGKYVLAIKIEPEAWNRNTGVFTVTILGLPEGYKSTDIKWASCDGAPVESIKAAGDKVILKFRRDMVTALPLDTIFVLLGQFADGVWFEGQGEITKIV
ncbi:MAG: CARDB domain-containing protein [Patescibacteria group bacterium]